MSESNNINIRYTYIRDRDDSERVLTIARRWSKSGKLHYAYALCRPDADHFRKDIGRKIASGRLLEKPTKLVVESAKYSLRHIMQDISKKKDTPRILHKIAEEWLEYQDYFPA